MSDGTPVTPVRGTHRAYCFTVNNPEFDPEFDRRFRYMVFGRETAPTTGTPHLQGYIYCHSPMRITTLHTIPGLERAHFIVARGTPDQNREYCIKEGDYKEFGTLPQQGKRSDLSACMEILKDNPTRSGMKRVLEEHPGDFIRYHKGFEKACEYLEKPPDQPAYEELREWQQELMNVIEETNPHPRHIHFYVDPLGGEGKSFMARLIYSLYPTKTLVLSNAKHDRLYHVYHGQTIIIFDMTRSLDDEHDNLPYQVMENMKNGYKPPGMYGTPPSFYPIPHVIVFCNQKPKQGALSADRYNITELSFNAAY